MKIKLITNKLLKDKNFVNKNNIDIQFEYQFNSWEEYIEYFLSHPISANIISIKAL
jgi:hypothetical protein